MAHEQPALAGHTRAAAGRLQAAIDTLPARPLSLGVVRTGPHLAPAPARPHRPQLSHGEKLLRAVVKLQANIDTIEPGLARDARIQAALMAIARLIVAGAAPGQAAERALHFGRCAVACFRDYAHTADELARAGDEEEDDEP